MESFSQSGKDYKPGELIARFEPLAHIIKEEFKSKFCDNCGKRSDQLKKCSKCHRMYYCDKECQQNDWKCHKFECEVYQNLMWEAIRSTFVEEGKTSIEKVKLDIRSWLCYDRLPNYGSVKHPTLSGRDICLDEIRADLRVLMTHPLITIFKKYFEMFGLKIDHDKFVQWQGIMNMIKNFEIPYNDNEDTIRRSVTDTKNIALVYVFQVSPYVNHSCVPNAYCEFEGFDMKLRAIRPIAKGDKITMNFIDLKQDKAGRQTEMLNKEMPLCQCNRCRLHLDKDLDYKEFLEIYSQIIRIGRAVAHGYSALELEKVPVLDFKIDFNHYLYLKEIFGEYHPIVSQFLVTSYVYFAENSRYASKSLLRLWYKEIEPIVRITHGSEHPYCKRFQEFASNYITI